MNTKKKFLSKSLKTWQFFFKVVNFRASWGASNLPLWLFLRFSRERSNNGHFTLFFYTTLKSSKTYSRIVEQYLEHFIYHSGAYNRWTALKWRSFSLLIQCWGALSLPFLPLVKLWVALNSAYSILSLERLCTPNIQFY